MELNEFVEQILLSSPAKSVKRYALSSFLSTLGNENISELDEGALRLWLVKMTIDGKKISTCKRYFSIVQSVYQNWCGNKDLSLFRQDLPVFDCLKEVDTLQSFRNAEYLKQFLDGSGRIVDKQTLGIFLYLLYNPRATLLDVISLTFDSAPTFCPQISEVVNSYDSSHGRKYVFQLNQGKARPNEISKQILKKLRILLSLSGMCFELGFSRASITSVWVAAALKSGISLKQIRACIGVVPGEYSVLSLIKDYDIEEFEIEDLLCRVADTINSSARGWFAMKLRPGVKVDDIKEYLDATRPEYLSEIEFFYPKHTVIHQKNGKRVVDEQPYMPNVLFFNIEKNKVKSLFANIGNLAWCFRSSNSPDSDYAVISQRQMANFQRCIGQFTPDVKVELSDLGTKLACGRKVRVVGGIMQGYEGEIIDVEDDPGKRVFFLSISAGTTVSWKAYVEDVFIQVLD